MQREWKLIPLKYDCECLGMPAVDGPQCKQFVKMNGQWYCRRSGRHYSRSVIMCGWVRSRNRCHSIIYKYINDIVYAVETFGF